MVVIRIDRDDLVVMGVDEESPLISGPKSTCQTWGCWRMHP